METASADGYTPHPSRELTELFTRKPYQGVAPDKATFLFVGLDANYDDRIATSAIFPKVLEYHDDGVTFWQAHGVHHPFLLPGYSGDGRVYHRNFARIGFRPEHSPLVSFVELLHVPTVGRNLLVPEDLSEPHLRMLNTAILAGAARYIFISAGVARLMRATRLFNWLPRIPTVTHGPLSVWFSGSGRSVYSYLHFSNYGKFAQRMAAEAEAIRRLLPMQ